MMAVEDSPSASGPRRAARASPKSPLEMPLRQSQGRSSSTDFAFLRYGQGFAEIAARDALETEPGQELLDRLRLPERIDGVCLSNSNFEFLSF